jgi:hypothetical protein
LDIWKVMICNFIGGAYEAIWKIFDYWKSLLLGLAHSHSVGRTLSGQTHTAPACNRPKATPALSVVRSCAAISLIGATHSLLLSHMHTTPLSPRTAHWRGQEAFPLFVFPISCSAQPLSCHAPLLYVVPSNAVDDCRVKPPVVAVLVLFMMLPNRCPRPPGESTVSAPSQALRRLPPSSTVPHHHPTPSAMKPPRLGRHKHPTLAVHLADITTDALRRSSDRSLSGFINQDAPPWSSHSRWVSSSSMLQIASPSRCSALGHSLTGFWPVPLARPHGVTVPYFANGPPAQVGAARFGPRQHWPFSIFLGICLNQIKLVQTF